MEKRVRVYIVDDEEMAVAYFKLTLEEASPAYEVAGEAFHGVSAYPEILSIKPDIVFLDISMPVMNGLELARKILKANPCQKIIFLTSYRDFDYVKEGMDIGVSSYMLKNEITGPMLRDVIEKIMAEKETEKRQAHSYAEQNIRSFLNSQESDMGQNHIYQDIPMQRFALLLFVLDLPIGFTDEKNGYADFDTLKLEALSWEGGVSCRNVINTSENTWCAVMFIGQEVSDSGPVLRNAGKRMIDEFLAENVSVSCLVSETVKNFTDLPAVYQMMKEREEYCFFYGKNSLLSMNEVRKGRGTKIPDPFSLLRSLEEEDQQEVLQQMDFLLDEGRCGYKRSQYAQLLWTIRSILFQFMERKKINILDCQQEQEFMEVEEVKSYFHNIIKQIFHGIDIQREKGYSYAVLQSLEYIHAHYSQDMSIQDIASAAGISEGYLRKCFKQEVQLPLIEYLTAYRIERAKKLMESRAYKISEIYRMVGFTSSQYFSYVFKKTEGMTPREYISSL